MNKRKKIPLYSLQAKVYRTLYTSRNQVPAAGLCSIVCAEELREITDNPLADFVLIDSRTPEEYSECHIPGAINIPEKRLEALMGSLPAEKDARLIFYCNGLKCGKSSRSAGRAIELGYRNVSVFSEGMPVWEENGWQFYKGPGYTKWIETTKMTPQELWSIISSDPDSVLVVDVCDKEEYAEEHIPGAINLPLDAFAAGSGIIDKQKKTVVYCKSGGRSHAAYKKLVALDYKRIYQLVLDDWKAAALPISTASAIQEQGMQTDKPDAALPEQNMAGVVMSVVIDTPLQRVFDFVATPHNWRRYITGLRDIRYALDRPLAAGDIFSWTYSLRGIDIQGTGKVVELVKNSRISLQMHTLLPIRKTICFEGDSEKTVVRVAVGCDSSGKVISFLFRAVTKMITKKESVVILERIKALCEKGLFNDELPVEAEARPRSEDDARSPNQGGILTSALASAFL